jgi:hypothetical protein
MPSIFLLHTIAHTPPCYRRLFHRETHRLSLLLRVMIHIPALSTILSNTLSIHPLAVAIAARKMDDHLFVKHIVQVSKFAAVLQ